MSGLGLWASCPDYQLDHDLAESTPPYGETGTWITCLRCGDSWPIDKAPGAVRPTPSGTITNANR